MHITVMKPFEVAHVDYYNPSSTSSNNNIPYYFRLSGVSHNATASTTSLRKQQRNHRPSRRKNTLTLHKGLERLGYLLQAITAIRLLPYALLERNCNSKGSQRGKTNRALTNSRHGRHHADVGLGFARPVE